jgi:Reversibly glycosylated polypeptide
MATATLVLTTISDPVVLTGYYKNFSRYSHLANVEVIVIPDRRTPPEAFATCERLARQGLKIICPTLDDQNRFLKRIGLNHDFIPYNSDNRRNVGYLMGLERRSDFLISIDDDNYCCDDEDYFGLHAAALYGRQQHTVADSETQFVNICDLLEFDCSAAVYPRGYPYYARHKTSPIGTSTDTADVMINGGLWCGDPDVDAITWLALRSQVRSFRQRSIVLDPRAWSPINSQNTALRNEIIPSYYFIRMGYTINGMPLDRYGDILSGYFALACAKHLGGTARFGSPIAVHRRNSHDYMKDASAEWHAIVLLEDLLRWLVGAQLSGSDCQEAYLCLSHSIEEAVEQFKGAAWTDASRGFFHQMAYLMRVWLSACHTIRS